MTKQKMNKKNIYSLRTKLFFIAVIIIVPMIMLSIYQIIVFQNYSTAYDSIVKNITYANNYNLNFKEDMDESMYKIVVEAETFESITSNENLANPYTLIDSARKNFLHLREISNSKKSFNWIKRILINLDTLENRVDEIRDNLDTGVKYEENISILESDIYILTELLQEEIQYYIYYESQNFEAIRKYLNEKVTNDILIMFISLGTIIIMSILANIIISKSITKPISQLCEKTAMIAKGDFTARAVCENKDEISLLADSFNDMAGKLEHQMERIKFEQENLRDMELKLLQTQINPHFLYNTLDTIIWLIEGKKNQGAIEMIEALSEFFRVVVSQGRDFIMIHEEEIHIKSYLQIQQSRYKDILDYEINIPDNLYKYQTLKLILQPLVENSLYHGIKMSRHKGKIEIRCEKIDEKICFYVIDNGVGINIDKLKRLRNEMEKSENNQTAGFGLINVNERIKLNYGNEYGLDIQSVQGEGTIIRVEIPAILSNIAKRGGK